MSDKNPIAPRMSWKDMKEPMSLEDYAAQRMQEQADQPAGNAKGIIGNPMRDGATNDGEWDPTSPEAIGWHGLFGFLSNYRSGEDPIRSPGHHYTHTEKICDGRTGNCDLNKTNAEALVVPGAAGRAPIKSGEKYTASAFGSDNTVVTTQTGPHAFRNTTVPGQHLFSGTVDRSFSQNPDGSIYATTTGEGRHPSLGWDIVNGLLGPGIFRSQNQRGADAVFGGHDQPPQKRR